MRFGSTSRPDLIAYHVDGVSMTDEGVVINGWAISTKGTVDFRLYKGREEIPFILKRTHLLDVSRTILEDDSQALCGFRIVTIPTDSFVFTLVFYDGVNTVKKKLDLRKGGMRRIFKPKMLLYYVKERKRAFRLMREVGFSCFMKQFFADLLSDSTRFTRYFKKHRPARDKLLRQRYASFRYEPKISLVTPAYKTPLLFLRELIASLEAQTYENWELCIADGSYPDTAVKEELERQSALDKRIVYTILPENKGISGNTNAALQLAGGDWIGLIDHDDLLEPNLLYECVKKINEQPETEAIYTDEGKITMDGKYYFGPAFKPAFDMEYLSSGNFICHFFMAKKSIFDEVGGFKQQMDGAQDLDMILRCSERRKVAHIPKMLYLWRCHPNSTAGDPESKLYCYEAGARAVNDHYKRMGIPAKAYIASIYGHYLAVFKKPVEEPLISVVIHGARGENDFEATKESILRNTDYRNFEFLSDLSSAEEAKGAFIFFISAGSTLMPFDKELVSYNETEEERAKIVTFPYNMIGRLQKSYVAVVGGKVLDRDRRYVYGGIYRNQAHAADYVPRLVYGNDTSYGGKFLDARRSSAASLHCMMVRRDAFMEAGGFSRRYKRAFMDVDLCYTLTEQGFYCFYDPTIEVRIAGTEPAMPMHIRYPDDAEKCAKHHKALLRETDPDLNPNMMIFMDNWVIRE